jgi:glycine cleavage system H protein
MTVILVLVTFLAFIVIDAILHKAPKAALDSEAEYVEGFHTPDQLRYHPGHAWLMRQRKNVMRVGVDEFASALAGKIEAIELPKPGHWIRQGQKAWTLHRKGEKAAMLSPVEGEVIEVNPDVVRDPSLVRKDPYGRGWLMMVYAPDEESSLRNLLPGNLVKDWMRNTAELLYGLQPQLAGAVAADGGRPAEDLAESLPGIPWPELTRQFLVPEDGPVSVHDKKV